MEAKAIIVRIYEMYACLRNSLNTTAAYEPLYINGEAILPTALVMILEDGDATLAERFEAERCPPPTVASVLTITIKKSKYNRSKIAKQAHIYAQEISSGKYRFRLSVGFKIAWQEAKGIEVEMGVTHQIVSNQLYSMTEIKANERWLKRTFQGRAAFEYDTLYYSEKYHTRTGIIIPQYA